MIAGRNNFNFIFNLILILILDFTNSYKLDKW